MLKVLSMNSLRRFLRNPLHGVAVGGRRVMTHAAVSFGRGYSLAPRNLTFFLTYRCNLRCNVCGQWGKNGYVRSMSSSQLKDELDIATLQRLIDEAAYSRPQITLCGGEVLLYKDWFEFMSYVKSKGLTCTLTTNGMILEEVAERLVDVGLDKLSLSLDGPARIHDAARGADRAFERATRGLQLVAEHKRRQGTNKPELEMGCTISDQNYRHLKDLIGIAESLDAVGLVFLHLAFLDDGQLNRQAALFRTLFAVESSPWEGYRYDPGDLDTQHLADVLEELKAYRGKLRVVVHPDFSRDEIERYYRDPEFVSASYRNVCLAPWMTAYVLPNGDISPCSGFVAGNIRTDRFKDIWNNDRFRHFRTELRRRGAFPVCTKCCELYKY